MDLEFPSVTTSVRDVALLKVVPSDFQVQELLDPVEDSSGEHCYLLIRKTDANTQWVADLLAKVLGVKAVAVGFAGMKDRRAVATQWFSVVAADPTEQQILQLTELSQGMVEVLRVTRGARKLRRGMHRGNQFKIRLEFSDTQAAERAVSAFSRVSSEGAPNYFGPQRFGSNGNNLQRALQHFQGQNRRRPAGIVVSAARSWLFNLVLAARVREGSWAEAGSFGEAEPTGPLWGRGRNPVSAELGAFEQQCVQDYAQWCLGLEHCGLSFERRALIILPEAANAEVDGRSVWFQFRLRPGCYATALLAECALLQLPARGGANNSAEEGD